jgi:glucose/arabinose dehydrogenase
MYAWGLRNPFGLKFDKSGQLWATWHGADVRGSRNIFNDPDYLAPIKQGAWYGWPEFFDGTPVTDPKFKDPTKDQPQFLWKDHPPLTKAFTTFASHAGVTGIDFSPGGSFGFEGDAFVALYGSFLPLTTGPNIKPEGFSVAKVDIKTGKVDTFAANKVPGPHYINRLGGFDRPSDVVFGPDQSLFVIDWGSSTIGSEGLKLVPFTGSVWRIYKDGAQQALRPNGPIAVPAAAPQPGVTPEPEVRTSPQTVGTVLSALAPILVALAVVIVLAIVGIRWVRRRT